jgi:hypothetical protein
MHASVTVTPAQLPELLLDELNGSSHEVQKAFYSLILDRRLAATRCTRSPW